MPRTRRLSTPALRQIAKLCDEALTTPGGIRYEYPDKPSALRARQSLYTARKQLGTDAPSSLDSIFAVSTILEPGEAGKWLLTFGEFSNPIAAGIRVGSDASKDEQLFRIAAELKEVNPLLRGADLDARALALYDAGKRVKDPVC